MGLFNKFFKKTSRTMVKGDEILNMSYESDTLNIINDLLKYLETIERLLEYGSSKYFKISDDVKKSYKNSVKSYNSLINNEILRLNSNNGGIFLSGEVSSEAKKLNDRYLINLNNSKLSENMNLNSLKKVKDSLSALSFFKKRLIVYLTKNE